MQTYTATHITEDGTLACMLVRLFGDGPAPVDAVREILMRHDIEPREVARAPDGESIERISARLGCPCKVMYAQGWFR